MATIKKSNDKYVVRYDVYENGQRKQRKRTFDRARDAKAFAATVQAAVINGKYAESKGITVEEYLTQWSSLYCGNLKANARYNILLNIEKHIIPRIGGIKLGALTAVDIQRLYNGLLETEWLPAKVEERGGLTVVVRPAKKYSGKTVREVHNTLNKALSKAVETRLISYNPCDAVELPRVRAQEIKPPSPDVERQVLNLCRDAMVYPAVMTTALLGIRRGEAAGLQWSSVNFANSTVLINHSYVYDKESRSWVLTTPKSETSVRTLPLPPLVIDLLKKVKAEQIANRKKYADVYLFSDFVFTLPNGQPYRPSSISQAFKRAAKRAGVSELRLHDLRHAYVTELFNMGYSPKVIQELVGHSSAAFTLKRYAHAVDDRKRDAAKAFSGVLTHP